MSIGSLMGDEVYVKSPCGETVGPLPQHSPQVMVPGQVLKYY